MLLDNGDRFNGNCGAVEVMQRLRPCRRLVFGVGRQHQPPTAAEVGRARPAEVSDERRGSQCVQEPADDEAQDHRGDNPQSNPSGKHFEHEMSLLMAWAQAGSS